MSNTDGKVLKRDRTENNWLRTKVKNNDIMDQYKTVVECFNSVQHRGYVTRKDCKHMSGSLI